MQQQAAEVREAVLEVTEQVLEAQLRAVRSLRREKPQRSEKRMPGRSQLDMAFDILASSEQPMHVGAIIEEIARRFGVTVDRESLVSALSKRVVRKDRFARFGPNIFGVQGRGKVDSDAS
jgi:hypothetical protein